jgi:hypothetical protein
LTTGLHDAFGSSQFIHLLTQDPASLNQTDYEHHQTDDQ